MTDHHITQLAARETTARRTRSFRRTNDVTNFAIDNLELEQTLHGHEGCVNCLDWNESGSMLASGSDDTKVIIWDFNGYHALKKVDTMHRGNIFSVKFMPRQDNVIVTGAADGQVFVYDVTDSSPIGSASVPSRVKRIVTTNAEPHIFISASEDGQVTQYDIRGDLQASKQVLVNVAEVDNSLECKCVAISPTNPNYFAIGCSDPIIRMYDRRNLGAENAVSFAPGHIFSTKPTREYVTTYLAFNASGNELLANIGNEQIYLFDINDTVKPYVLPLVHIEGTSQELENSGDKTGYSVSRSIRRKSWSLKWRTYHTLGNKRYDKRMYSSAISMYSSALSEKHSPLLFSNRAAAFIKRKWAGDNYAALRDCCSALSIDPAMVKAHYRLARCLLNLEHVQEAEQYLEQFRKIHPEHTESPAFRSLDESVKTAKQNKSGSDKSPVVDMFDYKYRYVGHCNTTTDIKEANFFGGNGQFIVAGSDEGNFYVWEHDSTNLVRVMRADSGVVNCLQPHPSCCMLATSGLDNDIKLWSPKISEEKSKFLVESTESLMEKNQQIMNSNPIASFFGRHGLALGENDIHVAQTVGCRQF